MAEHLAEHSDRVRRLFDAKAPTWSTKYACGGRLTGRPTRFAVALCYHVQAGGRVLDLGCGTGELSRAAAAAGMRVTGCDISPEMLRRASASDPGDVVDWVQLDLSWRTLPFESSAFDAVVAASVLEYVDDPSAVLGECARMLRPGGVVLCTVPDLTHPIRWLEWLAAVIARSLLPRVALRRWRSLEGYMVYLRISRQRHTARWWHATAAPFGLRPVPWPTEPAEHSPLRLLTFARSQDTGGLS